MHRQQNPPNIPIIEVGKLMGLGRDISYGRSDCRNTALSRLYRVSVARWRTVFLLFSLLFIRQSLSFITQETSWVCHIDVWRKHVYYVYQFNQTQSPSDPLFQLLQFSSSIPLPSSPSSIFSIYHPLQLSSRTHLSRTLPSPLLNSILQFPENRTQQICTQGHRVQHRTRKHQRVWSSP